MTRKSSTETLIAAMRILARDIQSGDGVANVAIAEAADRLAELQSHVMSEHLRDATKMAEQQARIAELERHSLSMCKAQLRNESDAAWRLLAAEREALKGLRAEYDQSRAKVSELERQAAIGRRAVAILIRHQHVADISLRASYCPECHKIQRGHFGDCAMAAILRDAEQDGMGVE